MMIAMEREIEPAELRGAACDLARLGAAVAEQHFGHVTTRRKADDSPVTDADHAVQEAILSSLARRYPSHAILVEEVVARPDRHAFLAGARYCWVVDPIDGTRNYGRGSRLFATSVAVLLDGRPVAGAIHDAASQQIYSASIGDGAFLDDLPLRRTERPIGPDTTIALSSFRFRRIPEAARRWQDEFLFRNVGAICLHLAWTAAGVTDAAYALECKLWDVAAGALLIEQAGAPVTDPAGAPLWPIDLAAYRGNDVPILGGAPQLHARLLADLRKG